MSDVNCPYCGEPQEICHDDDYGFDEDELHEQQCGSCEKKFGFETCISFDYEAKQVPCFNGEPHALIHSPIYGFPDRQTCPSCGYVKPGDYVFREDLY